MEFVCYPGEFTCELAWFIWWFLKLGCGSRITSILRLVHSVLLLRYNLPGVSTRITSVLSTQAHQNLNVFQFFLSSRNCSTYSCLPALLCLTMWNFILWVYILVINPELKEIPIKIFSALCCSFLSPTICLTSSSSLSPHEESSLIPRLRETSVLHFRFCFLCRVQKVTPGRDPATVGRVLFISVCIWITVLHWLLSNYWKQLIYIFLYEVF